MGYGLVPVPVVEERLQEDGKDAIARERVARALVSPEVYGISEEMELAWEVEPGDVRRWPVRPETRVEYFAPPGAEEEIPGTTCTYRRFSLASVQVVIDRDGALVSKKVVQSSGSRRLDREVMDLVTRSAPFPPPNPRDLNASGVNETLWDVGVRDYRISSCIYIKGPRLVKDIVLERVN